MTHRLLLSFICVLCGAALAAPTTPAAAATSGKRTCRPAGTKTVASSVRIRVYRQRGRYGHDVFACRYASGRRTVLGPDDWYETGGSVIHRVVIAGDYVAFGRVTGDQDGIIAYGRVVDTRSRRVIRSVQRGGLDETALLGDAVLTPRGTAAFSFQVTDFDTDTTRGVVEIADGPTKGSSRIVAESPDIAQRSLALASDGKSVIWLQGGQLQTAPIA